MTAGISTVDRTQLGSQHDTGNDGEQRGGGVEGEHHQGYRDALVQGRCETEKRGQPGEHDDEHGEVDGGAGGGGGGDVEGDDVADEGGEDDEEEELQAAENEVYWFHFDGLLEVFFLVFRCCGSSRKSDTADAKKDGRAEEVVVEF